MDRATLSTSSSAFLFTRHEEGDLDVRADVVLADQAFLAAPVDLDRLDRDIHVLGAVDDRHHQRPGEGDDGVLALSVLMISALP